MENKIKELQEKLGLRLKFLRVAKTGVQSEFKMAKIMGMGEVTIYKIEHGENLPTKRTLLDIKKWYELTNQEYKDLQDRIKEIKKLKRAVKQNECI